MNTLTYFLSIIWFLTASLSFGAIDEEIGKILQGAEVQNVVGEVFLPIQPRKGDRITDLRIPSDNAKYYTILLSERPSLDGGKERPYVRFHGTFQRLHPHVTRNGFGFSIRCGSADKTDTAFVEATFLCNIDSRSKTLQILLNVWNVYEEVDPPYGFMACMELTKKLSEEEFLAIQKFSKVPMRKTTE